eukprot:1143517-Pelagomonas_calceolata.AAC.3
MAPKNPSTGHMQGKSPEPKNGTNKPSNWAHAGKATKAKMQPPTSMTRCKWSLALERRWCFR